MTKQPSPTPTVPEPPRSGIPAIEVHELVREFHKGPRAVDGIQLAGPGEIYGFLGRNGAGKSTTVLILTTLLAPTSGHASVGGFDVVREARQVRETIGVALQEVALDEMLTAREHLRFQTTLHGIPRRPGADIKTNCRPRRPDHASRSSAACARMG